MKPSCVFTPNFTATFITTAPGARAAGDATLDVLLGPVIVIVVTDDGDLASSRFDYVVFRTTDAVVVRTKAT